ncbi:hypothetical protein TNCV_863841 [Trichonephila clavipes]|nr:hypothetical protein TNCV_863841 [Trichonephila clavipes]
MPHEAMTRTTPELVPTPSPNYHITPKVFRLDLTGSWNLGRLLRSISGTRLGLVLQSFVNVDVTLKDAVRALITKFKSVSRVQRRAGMEWNGMEWNGMECRPSDIKIYPPSGKNFKEDGTLWYLKLPSIM